MRNSLQIILVFLLSFVKSNGQDTISIVGMGKLGVKVVEITSSEVKYKLFDQPKEPVYIAVRSAVEFIHYQNGRIENLETVVSNSVELEVVPHSDSEWEKKGKEDAILNYEGENSGSFLVGTATVLFTPLLGWIPAVALSSFPPSETNLNILDYRLRQNKPYYRSYLKQAQKIKRNKIFTSYGVVSYYYLFFLNGGRY